MARVACIGAGSWGTAVAAVLAGGGHEVVLWCRRPELANEIRDLRTNPDYLPGIRLPDSLCVTSDVAEALRGAEVCVMGVPSHAWRDILRLVAPHLGGVDAVVSLTKGLEAGTNFRMSQVLAAECPAISPDRFAMLAGPNIAKEVARNLPAAAALACSDSARAERLQHLFHRPTFRVYAHTDVVGCELGGAIKNVVAVAAGIADELGLGDNALAALMTRGLAELTRLGVRLGGDPLTFAGLAGMGDMVVTCISRYSRNRRVGKELAKGRRIEDVIGEMKMVAEGVKTARPILELGRAQGAWMPITESVVAVIEGAKSPRQALEDLLALEPVTETFGVR